MAHKLKENKVNSLLDTESLAVTSEEELELANKLESHDMPKNAGYSTEYNITVGHQQFSEQNASLQLANQSIYYSAIYADQFLKTCRYGTKYDIMITE